MRIGSHPCPIWALSSLTPALSVPTWQRHLEEQKQEICRRNELASLDHCTATLLELSDELDDQIGRGSTWCPGATSAFWTTSGMWWTDTGRCQGRG